MEVTVITPTIPGRSRLLDRCIASVEAQTVRVEHLVRTDETREGPAPTRNHLAAQAQTRWLLPLDDDDTLDPTCVQTLLANAEHAEIVYPWCRMENRTDNWVPNKLFTADALFKQNFIPVTALIDRNAFLMMGGYQNVPMEDWALWQWAHLHGLSFKCVPEVLWTYHFHEQNEFQYQR